MSLEDKVAELELELFLIRQTGSLKSVDSWMQLSDQQKRDWFATTLKRDSEQCKRIKELEQLIEDNANMWNDAYSAFKGAFDTPIARRKMSDEYAEDARARLSKYNVTITNKYD